MDSEGEDESRLLRGQALILAEEWAKNKSLSYQDREFLAASKNKEIEEENKKAQLERERKDKEAELKREKKAREVAEAANRQAQRRIRIGSIVLGVTLLGATIIAVWGKWQFEKAVKAQNKLSVLQEQYENVDRLSELGLELLSVRKLNEASMVWKNIGLSFRIKDHEYKQAFLLSSISLAHQELGELKNGAREAFDRSLEQLPLQGNLDVPENWSTYVYVHIVQGSLLKKEGETQEAIESFAEAFDRLDNKEIPIMKFLPQELPILSVNAVEILHREYIELLSEVGRDAQTVKNSLRNHLLAELNFLMESEEWRDADVKNDQVMLHIANREKEGYPTIENLKNFSCPALYTLDKLWVKHSGGRFGFSVQKEILDKILAERDLPRGKYNDLKEDVWKEFYTKVGWYSKDKGFKRDYNIVEIKEARKGHLPWMNFINYGLYSTGELSSRTATCGL